ncbi:hypothetical protein FJZ18_01120 [Candidatus Pacearchaeota archaeon]|nr:hypothetical protein [Candidatus Pacearchaeota archaeon]
MKDRITPREALERKAAPLVFFDHIPQYNRNRIISSEQENGQKLRKKVHKDYEKKSGWETEFTAYLSGFLPDVVSLGGRIYADANHVEFARAECSSPLEAVVHEDAFDRFGFNLLTGTLRLVRKLYKNSIDFGNPKRNSPPVSFGFHENYSTKIMFGQSNPSGLLALVPHLISRTIFGGAGSLHKANKFLRAQRSLFVNKLWSFNAIKDERGIICTRVQPHTEISGLQRLQLTCGDALISPVNRFLLYGTTATVVDLIEDRIIPLCDYDTSYAVEDFHGITYDPENYILRGFPSKNWTALDVQRRILDSAIKSYSHRDPQTNAILFLWEDTLNKLEYDPFQLVGRLDAITKKALYTCLDERFPDVPEDSFWQMRGIDMNYHDINPNYSIFQVMRSEGIMEDLYSNKLFSWYMQNPPPKTRAHFRGNLAKILIRAKEDLAVLDGDEWDKCVPLSDIYNIYPNLWDLDLSIDDPFNSYNDRLTEIKGILSH